MAHHKILPPALIRLLVGIGILLVLPHIAGLSLSFIIISFSLLSWRMLTTWFPRLIPRQVILLPLSIGLAFFVLQTFGMSLGRDASSSLLIILMGLKLLESKTTRDAQAVIYMCFFVLITPFLFDQRVELALYALVVFFFLLFALIINNAHRQSLKQPALLRISGKILLQALPLMLIFFLLFPRMIGPLWSMPDEQSAISGLSDTINPGAISNLALSDETAFRVRFKAGSPPQNELYWRGPVFWDTDGRTWSHTLKMPNSAIQNSPETTAKTYQYTLMMEPHQQHWLYALDSPISTPNNVQLTADKQLILKNKLSRNLAFSITSSTSIANKVISDVDRARALMLPTNIDPRVINLAKQWKHTSNNSSDIIRQALLLFNEAFYYTLRPPSLGDNPVAEFLFETKRGFCGHFATSFATLMRAAGLPARLIGGYQGGVYNNVGEFYNIRQADAHVWVEVWQEQQGWVRIDPTAAIAPNRIEHSVDASQQHINGSINFLMNPPEGLKRWGQQLTWITHSIDYYWQNSILAYGPEKQLAFLSIFGIVDWGDMILWLSLLSGGFLITATGLLFLYQPKKTDPVQAAYLSLCKKIARKTQKRHSYETASAYFQRLSDTYPSMKPSLEVISALYSKTRYGNGEAQIFINAVKRFKLKT